MLDKTGMPELLPASHPLDPFFAPRGVAVIGASRDPGKLSYGVLRNLLDPQGRGYRGPIYPVNPSLRITVCGSWGRTASA